MTKPREDSPVLFAVMFSTIAASGLICVVLIFLLTVSCDSEYAVIVDFGSTHTQVSAFKWPQCAPNNTHNLKQIWSEKCKGDGILGLFPDYDKVKRIISDCLASVLHHIPKVSLQKTPIIAGATGGFRLLQEENDTIFEGIISQISNVLNETELLFQDGYMNVLSGKQEAAYDWIGGNYILDKFKGDNSPAISVLDWGQTSSLGATSNLNSTEETTVVTILSKQYNVVSYSSMCLGVKQVYLRHLSWMITDPTDIKDDTIEDPCSPLATVMNKTVESLFLGICTFRNDLVPIRAKIEAIKDKEILIKGNWNAAKCQMRLSQLLDTETCEKKFVKPYCPQQFVFPGKQEIYASSLYYAIASVYDMTKMKSLEQLRTVISETCNLNWDKLKEKYFSKVQSEQLLFILCFESQFMLHFLTNKVQMDSENMLQLYFVDEVNGEKFGWSIGYLMAVLFNKNIEISPPLPIPIFATLTSVFTILFIASVSFIIWDKKKSANEKTEPVKEPPQLETISVS